VGKRSPTASFGGNAFGSALTKTEAEAAAALSKGLKQTKTNLDSAYEQRKAEFRKK
ncbi:MAG: hypothetical protein HOG95_19045, partial [Rhodospirillaceae bacterium]|nr:hypothetical protein [Rhodospirillaceae bacterium]